MKDVRKWKEDTIENLQYLNLSYISIDKLITELESYKTKAEQKGWRDIKIDHTYDYEYGTDYNLKGLRLETDEEFKHRIKQREYSKYQRIKRKKEKKQSERQLYEKLKKKFEE